MIPSDPYRPRDPAHGTPAWIKAILSTAILVLALAFLLAAVGMSEDGSSASSGPSPDTTLPPTPTFATAGTSGSTPTYSPQLATMDARLERIEDNTARRPPKRPTPYPTPFPTCPADGSGVDCYFEPPTPTVPVRPTPTPLLACDSLRTAVAAGQEVDPGWCSEDPAPPRIPGE